MIVGSHDRDCHVIGNYLVSTIRSCDRYRRGTDSSNSICTGEVL